MDTPLVVNLPARKEGIWTVDYDINIENNEMPSGRKQKRLKLRYAIKTSPSPVVIEKEEKYSLKCQTMQKLDGANQVNSDG